MLPRLVPRGHQNTKSKNLVKSKMEKQESDSSVQNCPNDLAHRPRAQDAEKARSATASGSVQRLVLHFRSFWGWFKSDDDLTVSACLAVIGLLAALGVYLFL